MDNAYILICGLFVAIILGACSSSPPQSIADAPEAIRYQGNAGERLAQHYRNWQGTPHKMGGLSHKGIDCSGFVYITYRDVFGKRLPRSTDQLAHVGEQVSPNDHQLGDLLIFQTSFKQKHAGIYIGNGRFIHASSSRGVMTSSVKSEYWADAYRQTRRVLD